MILALIFASGFALLYDDAFMQIIINDRLFPKIYLKCGVRHGDPLSPLSNVLCVEVLFSLTSGSPEIKAFLLPGANAYMHGLPFMLFMPPHQWLKWLSITLAGPTLRVLK